MLTPVEEGRIHELQRDVMQAVRNCSCAATLHEVLAQLQLAGTMKDASCRSTSAFGELQCLRDLRDAPGVLGFDIGGTMAKMALMKESSELWSVAERFGTSGDGSFHAHLSFELLLSGTQYEVHFISGTTFGFEQVLCDAIASRSSSSCSSRRRVLAAGGGAHRLATPVRNALGLDLVPLKEMESLVRGLAFLHDCGPLDEVFEVNGDGIEKTVTWPPSLFPCLLVNIGSGVSILRVKSEHSFDRIGGTACGGATFLGLVRLMTSANTFEEALKLAHRGDSTRVDKLVHDIYGSDGCKDLGLPPGLTAAHFGKLASVKGDVRASLDEADIAAALLLMVTQASSVLARAFLQTALQTPSAPAVQLDMARAYRTIMPRSKTLPLQSPQALRSPPVFFVGGFLADNPMARQFIAQSFHRLGCTPAKFLRHADFLGALGSMAVSFQDGEPPS